MRDRMIPDSVGSGWVLSLAAAALAVSRRRLTEAGAALLCFASLIAVFTNLHVVHNYYQYANAIFLVAVCGFAGTARIRRSMARRRVRPPGDLGDRERARLQEPLPPDAVPGSCRLVHMGALVAKITVTDEVVAATGLRLVRRAPLLRWPARADPPQPARPRSRLRDNEIRARRA
jgi:hypothetical protein